MKFNFKKIKDFIIKRYVILTIIILPLGVVIFLTGMITYNESSKFCYSCHTNRGPYSYIDKKRPVHQDVDQNMFSCINCHKDKRVQTIYLRDIKKYQRDAQLMGNLQSRPLVNPKDVYNSEQCLICHPDRLDVVERDPYLLASDRLKEIGLRFDKRLHYRFETLREDDRILYEELSGRGSLTENEVKELALLGKIRLGNCGQCHIQTKIIDGNKIVDKQVNYIARNPISCAGCHEDASSLNHPGEPLKTPTKEVCQKCHHGKMHGRFLIFKADCIEQKDTQNCIKCHPFYKP